MSVKSDLSRITGTAYVSDEPEMLAKYSRDYSYVQPCNPSWVVFPGETEEVREILKYANQRSIAVTPRSSRVGFNGAGIPTQGGIVVDLVRMNKIIEIDEADRNIKVEAGVTWEQAQNELEKHGMMVCNPLLPHREQSVLTGCMQREPMLIPKGEFSEPFRTGEIVLGTGEVFYLGTAIAKGFVSRSNPDCFIPSTRIFMGAQGTLGIITWANLGTIPLPVMNRIHFMPFKQIADAVEPIYRIQRKMLGNECLLLDSLNLANIVGENEEDCARLRRNLPPFMLVLVSSARRLPEEKIEYEEEALNDISLELNFKVLRNLPEIPDIHKRLLPRLRKPWTGDQYWKLRYKGGWHGIFFHTTLDRAPEFAAAISNLAIKHRYAPQDMDVYIQPLERARACYCQFGLHNNPGDARETEAVKALFLEASEKMAGLGGLFANPYGPWADMVYDRTAVFTQTLKTIKDVLDPHHIMNPGKLCF
jgi:FAD/FMN-containing dehydrogenase